MSGAELLRDLLAKTGAMLEGHFLLSSGLHSGRYLQCALLLSFPEYAARAGAALAGICPGKPDLVVSPALGGIVIGHETAKSLGCRAVFAEREQEKMTLRRGFAISPGQKIVVVEDVITTGESTGEVVALARGMGARVLAVLALICRAPAYPDLGVPVLSLLHLPLQTATPPECGLCRQNIPLVKPGSRPSQG